jgi:hypothetical protein
MDNHNKGKLGEEFVMNYLEKEGYQTRKATEENGCDIIAAKDGKEIKIEVKTTKYGRKGIPDMHDTEFVRSGDEWFLVPDYLYIVRLGEDETPCSIDILNKEEVDRYSKNHKTVTRIRTARLDTDLKNGKVGKEIKIKNER